jgi:signal peptidase I
VRAEHDPVTGERVRVDADEGLPEETADPADRDAERPSASPHAVRRWAESLLVALLIVTFGATTVGIEGSSMAPSLQDGDRAFVPRYETWLGRLGATSLQYGDVVYFRAPGDEPRSALERLTGGPFLIKRVVARGGDVVELRGGRLIVNGSSLPEPYLGNGPAASVTIAPTVVPEDHVFVLGDNRAPLGSRDSRAFGAVPASSVGGRAAWVVWPPFRVDERGALGWNVRRVAAP